MLQRRRLQNIRTKQILLSGEVLPGGGLGFTPATTIGDGLVFLTPANLSFQCPDGWTGPLCDEQINNCAEEPCLLGANCTNLVNDFKCECPNGFAGKRCENKVDLCANNECVNGECVDKLYRLDKRDSF